jgi:energy-coupling factor transporter ATP-binding protein EcfA2
MLVETLRDVAQGGVDWGLTLTEASIWGAIVASVTCVIAIVPMTRNAVLWFWWAMILRGGLPRRRYARWFIREWGVFDNPYLGSTENLDLRDTYVPLNFRSGDAAEETLILATAMLASSDTGNLVIHGAPGSGKSTLLKAYGVGVLEAESTGRSLRVVPFLVRLRRLARFLTEERDLADYLVMEVLVKDAGFRADQAYAFLADSLSRRQVVVMLDGLDEVMTDDYEAVRDAVFDFTCDRTFYRPTFRAKVLLTCRTQDFLLLRDDWIPSAFGKHEYLLAPLRNSEIFNYLDKNRRLFKSADGPENFMKAVRAAGTLDLLRTPLILAMSVGLYSSRGYFPAPASIANFYRTLILEMLDRHSFKHDRNVAALMFPVADKYRFLREFALTSAVGPNGFGGFGLRDLLTAEHKLTAELKTAPDVETFVREIAIQSGLLFQVSDAGEYVYAHRVIHEYLAAEELSRRRDGDDVLLNRVADPEWRNVFILYVALVDDAHRERAAQFIEALARRSVTLAGECLRFASVGPDVAKPIVAQLARAVHARDNLTDSLTALHSASSPPSTVQALATQHLLQALGSFLAASEVGIRVTSAANVSSLARLLHEQLTARTAELLAAASAVLRLAPSDVDLVEMLWRWLSVPSVERLPITRTVVARLLRLADDQQFRNALDGLPPTGSKSAGSNYEALIKWAEQLNVVHEPGVPVDAYDD